MGSRTRTARRVRRERAAPRAGSRHRGRRHRGRRVRALGRARACGGPGRWARWSADGRGVHNAWHRGEVALFAPGFGRRKNQSALQRQRGAFFLSRSSPVGIARARATPNRNHVRLHPLVLRGARLRQGAHRDARLALGTGSPAPFPTPASPPSRVFLRLRGPSPPVAGPSRRRSRRAPRDAPPARRRRETARALARASPRARAAPTATRPGPVPGASPRPRARHRRCRGPNPQKRRGGLSDAAPREPRSTGSLFPFAPPLSFAPSPPSRARH